MNDGPKTPRTRTARDDHHEHLVARCTAGDETAWAELRSEMQPLAHSILRNYERRFEVAGVSLEGLADDSLLEAVGRFDASRGKFCSYFGLIVKGRANKMWKSLRDYQGAFEASFISENAPQLDAISLYDLVTCEDPRPGEPALWQAVRNLLSQYEWDALICYNLHGLTYAETAAVLSEAYGRSISEKSIDNCVQRSFAALALHWRDIRRFADGYVPRVGTPNLRRLCSDETGEKVRAARNARRQQKRLAEKARRLDRLGLPPDFPIR